MTQPTPSRLVPAIVLAVAVHAAAATIYLLDRPAPTLAANAGDGGIMLLIAATAAGSSATPETYSEETAEPYAEEPPPETTPTAPEPAPKTERVLSPEAIQPLALEEQPRLEPVVRAHRNPKTPSPDPRPVPIPKRKPVPEKQVTGKQTTKTPTPPKQVRAQTAPAPLTSETYPASTASTNGNNGMARQTQNARSGGGRPNEHGAYFAAVRNWLHAHKRYPRRARLRMMRGEAVIGFVLDRSGRVVSYELRRSTGHGVLDREVLAMIRRASPMPSFPPDMNKERMDFSVPVRFDIN